MYQRGRACVDERLDLWRIGDVRKSDIELRKVAKGGADGGEVSMEEDSMKHG